MFLSSKDSTWRFYSDTYHCDWLAKLGPALYSNRSLEAHYNVTLDSTWTLKTKKQSLANNYFVYLKIAFVCSLCIAQQVNLLLTIHCAAQQYCLLKVNIHSRLFTLQPLCSRIYLLTNGTDYGANLTGLVVISRAKNMKLHEILHYFFDSSTVKARKENHGSRKSWKCIVPHTS